MRYALRSAVSLAIMASLSSPLTHAFQPSVSIVEPTGVQYVDSFPVTVPVTLQLELRNANNDKCMSEAVNSILVEASLNGVDSVVHSVSNPSLGNLCPATYQFDWQVTQPGSYSFVVTARHGNDDGSVTEEVEFIAMAVEYPAPPAVANAYINANDYLKSLPGRQRGCVISAVAEKHAKLAGTPDGYGPKGGPYDVDAIQMDVDALFAICKKGGGSLPPL